MMSKRRILVAFEESDTNTGSDVKRQKKFAVSIVSNATNDDLSKEIANRLDREPNTFTLELPGGFELLGQDGILYTIHDDEIVTARAVSTPSIDSYPAKRRAEPEEPRTSVTGAQGTSRQTDDSPRITQSQAWEGMSAALKPFHHYIRHLAEGTLDCYFNSTPPMASTPDLHDVQFPKSNNLLLHDLGNHPDKARLRALFKPDTVHLFSVSGSGKTRLSLEGLCLHWGLYISCRPGSETRVGGSRDFINSTTTMENMRDWDDTDGFNKNVDVACRVFEMILCARFFVLKHLLEQLPPDTDAVTARRRWVLIQAMPPYFENKDVFSIVLAKLRQADTDVLMRLTKSIYNDLPGIAGNDIFPPGEQLFVVVDEAQQGVEYLKESFPSTSGSEKRPVLHPFHAFLWNAGYFQGVILAGTGLSRKMVEKMLGSQTAKLIEHPKVFVDVGRIQKGGADHESYIRKYLPTLADNVVDRITYWFTGRYRFTASLIELLLETKSPHRVLSAFAEFLTGFTITDALDLEEQEPPLSEHTLRRIKDYGTLGTADRLFETQEHIHLLIRLSRALMRWRIGSQASVPMEGDMNDIIMLGIGHMETSSGETFLPTESYPVYLSEPLVVLYLSSLFAKYSWTTKEEIVKQAFASGKNNQTLGSYEEAVLLLILHMFGGKACTLSDAFHTDQPWGSRKVTLVSLKRRSDGIMQSCPVSPSSGSSDRLGLKATSPEDILNFLENPDGKCFLFPDCHMGPDLFFFLQDVETMELMGVPMQGKLTEGLAPAAWHRAVQTVTPEYFYTAKTKDGDRRQHAPVKYSDLSKDSAKASNLYLGAAEYKPAVPEPKMKLRSVTTLEKTFPDKSQRQTPKILRIIATVDDKQDNRLREAEGGDLGVLRWDRMQEYLGSTIRDALKKSLVPYLTQHNGE